MKIWGVNKQRPTLVKRPIKHNYEVKETLGTGGSSREQIHKARR